MELACPKCGRIGRLAKAIPAGKIVRCPRCKETFQALPPDSEPIPVNLSIVNDEPSIISEASIIHAKKPSRGFWALVILMPFVFGGGVFAGRISSPKAAEPTPPPTASVDRTEDNFNKLINPVTTAAIYWSETEAKLRELCVEASAYLLDRKHLIGPGEIAAMLTVCGRVECDWRGKEKCMGADFVVGLYAEMLLEGTESEDALRILANLHRLRPNKQPNQTAAKCEVTRKSTYNILKMGKMISLENSLDQLLSNVNLVQGNEAFSYHRQTD